ncbi:MAG: type II toxin-antitoxin system HigB family toxin [Xanthobacteraceae bacterium]
MQVIARRTLREFWQRHPQAERPIRAWFAVVSKARWKGPADVKRRFGTTVDFVGNKYRLVVHVSYAFGRVLVKFVGTHADYDRIDPETVRWRK